MRLGPTNMRRIDLTGGVVTGCILAVFYAFGLRPMLGAMTQRVDAAQTVQELQRLNTQAGSNVLRLKATLNSLDRQLAGVHLLSDRTQANHTISLVTELALNEGLIVESGTANEPEDHDIFAVVPIHLSGKGEFIAATRFIHALSEKHADIEVRSITLDSGSGAIGGPSAFRIELAWYVLPD
jgi:Tfp pilus assembly protein PilO